MKRKIIILLSLLLASIAVQAATLPKGLWKVAQITIEKNTDGNIQTNVYNAADEVKSYISCPQEWEINAQNIVMRYSNGQKKILSSYIIDNNQLMLQTDDDIMPPYRYSINNENLILITTYNYVNNLPTGETEHINEKWIITLKKQT